LAKFVYEAKNDQGQLVRGMVVAPNESAAEKLLQRNRFVVTSLEVGKSPFSAINIFNKVGVRDRAQFARQLATMISAGLPLVQALNIITMQTRQPKMHTILASVVRDIESGFSFSTALAKHTEAFDSVFIAIVRSGEATGKLDQVLLELADQSEKDASFSGKIKGALAYPAFIICAMIGVAILMMTQVIPTIKAVFEEANAQLPFATRMLIIASDYMVEFWYIVIVAVIGFVVAARLFLMSKPGKLMLDKLALHAPIFSQTATSIIMARLTRTLGLLVGSGIPILESISIVSEVINNNIYKEGLREVRAQVERGIPMSVPLLKNKEFPVLFGQMVSVGEQTGRIDAMLANLAKFYSEDSDTKLKGMTTLIEPVVMVILGVGVAFLIFAILVPIYNISSIG
jgi:type IV pilus assembly protein PilC